MPPLPSVPKCLKITLTHTLGEDLRAQVAFHMQFSGSEPDNALLNTFCSAIDSLWNTYVAPLSGIDVLLTQVDCIDLSSPSGPVGTAVVSTIGTRTGPGLPADSAGVLSLEVPRRYRGGHPRNYWPIGVQADLEDPQTWDAGFISTAETDLGTFLGTVSTSGWPGYGSMNLVNISYYQGFTAVENPITHRWRNVPNVRVTPVVDTVSGTIFRPFVGSQRRRQHPR